MGAAVSAIAPIAMLGLTFATGGATAPLLSLAATGLGAGISAFGAIQEGRSARAQGKFNAQVARNNAILARRQAGNELEASEQQVGDLAEQGEFTGNQAKVALAGNGVRLGDPDGSEFDIAADIRHRTQRNISRTRKAGLNAAQASLTQAQNFEQQATLAEAKGENAQKASFIKASTTIASGAGQVASQWSDFADQGIDINPFTTKRGQEQRFRP